MLLILGKRVIVLGSMLLMLNACTYTFYQTSCKQPVAGRIHKVSTLSKTLKETSGLAATDSLLVSFNDSGGDPALYFFTLRDSGKIRKKVLNAENSDWEDIAADMSYFYIADVGNNYGSRDTLVIYRVSLQHLGEKGTNEVERITFSYSEPVEHTSKGRYSHDCEAMFAYGDSLYLFAKDWVRLNTRVYVIPKTPGHYNIKSRVGYPVKALITGADINPGKKEVILVGYRNMVPVLIRYHYLNDPALIQCGGAGRRYPRLAGTQMEGVCYDNQGRILLSAEKLLYNQALYLVK